MNQVMLAIGPPEMFVIAAAVVLLFGARKLPELARSLGSSVTQFKKGLKEGEEEPPQISGGGDEGGEENP